MARAWRGGSIACMSAKNTAAETRLGDWLETRGNRGEPARRGQIVEVLGESGHEHYQVRWEDWHESIVFPADGVRVIHRTRP